MEELQRGIILEFKARGTWGKLCLVYFEIGESYEYPPLFWDIIALSWTNIIKRVSKINAAAVLLNNSNSI